MSLHINTDLQALKGVIKYGSFSKLRLSGFHWGYQNFENLPRGTMVTKPVTCIDSDVYQRMMLENVLPAIKERWPVDNKKPIIIQEDNCRVHTAATRNLVEAAGKQMGMRICVHPQPPKSPDFNILDLGFFHSIQTLKDQHRCESVDDLVAAVDEAFWNEPWKTLDNTFLSLQGTLIDSLTVDGNNSYKVRHFNKKKLRRLNGGVLPSALKCDPLLIARAREVLDEPASLEEDAESRFKAVGVGPNGRSKFEGDGVIFV